MPSSDSAAGKACVACLGSGYLLPHWYPLRNDRRCHKCPAGEDKDPVYAYCTPEAADA